MADRYQNRSYPADDGYDRGDGSRAPGQAESDPLAELARLIGQTDPFGSRPMSRANLPAQPQGRPADPEPAYDDYADHEPEEIPPPAPPSWMQRAARQEPVAPPPQVDYPSAVHPLHRYAAAHPPAEPDYDQQQQFADHGHDQGHEPDLSRYDDALYGGFDSDAQHAQHEGYADDSYYEEDQLYDAQPEPRRRGGMITVAAVLALAVFGVGGAFAYRTLTGGTRSGEPPIIRADAGPTKIIPAPADAATKVPDRMAVGDGTEKIVSREEAPIDPKPSGPRVVFPPLTPNGSAPMPASVVPGSPPTTTSATSNGTFSNNEPHAVRTVSVRGDQASSGAPVTAPPAAPAKPSRAAAAGSRPTATNANVANANGPLSLAPQADTQAAPEPVRVATTNPAQIAPSAPATPSAAAGGYLVQVSSQRSEADAHAAYRTLQNKYGSVLGSQSMVVKRVDLGEKGIYFRAFAGPFSSSEQASQVCNSLKAAGGPQCLIQRN